MGSIEKPLGQDTVGAGGIGLFPSSSNADPSDSRVGSIRLSTSYLVNENKAGDVCHVQNLLCTAWAIVLGQFLHADRVIFGVDNNLSHSRSKQICQANRTSGGSVEDFATSAHFVLSPADDSEAPVDFNTGIVIQEGEEKEDTRYDIALVVEAANSEPRLVLMHRHRCLTPDYASHLASTISHALQSIIRDPTQQPAEVPLCTSDQTEKILSWQTNLVGPSYPTYHTALASGYGVSPRQAVESFDGSFTYAELSGLSSGLACHLHRKYGITTGSMVMVCTGKTKWMVVAMLAINMAGGCIVLSDPLDPALRRQAMMDECQTSLVITSPEHQGLFVGKVREAFTITTTTMSAFAAPYNHTALPYDSAAPAYCSFTSGSTGTPKGVLVSHAALSALVLVIPYNSLSPSSRVLQFSKLGFSLCYSEIFCTLAAGGTVCIPSEEEQFNDLRGVIARRKVNWAFLSPTVLSSLQPSSVPSLKTVFLVGEIADETVVANWMPSTSLFNGYGLSELVGPTIISKRIQSSQQRSVAGIPCNTRLWLVDPDCHDRLAPIGAVAELLVEGPCLAMGYLNDTEGTDAVFIPYPAWRKGLWSSDDRRNLTESSRKLYKTGDLVRYHEDGMLSFVGRTGLQTKLRGQRLNPEEIESHIIAVLGKTPRFAQLQRVVVLVLEPTRGIGSAPQSILTAFILLPEERSRETSRGEGIKYMPMQEDTREELALVEQQVHSRLPMFMVPQLWLLLTDLPRTVTGKVDRNRIKREVNAMSYEELRCLAGLQATFQPPITEAEIVLQSVTCETLSLSSGKVGMRDHFFHLGGNSMSAIQLVTRAKERGWHIEVADIFANPVLSGLSSVMRTLEPAEKQIQPDPQVNEHNVEDEWIWDQAAAQCQVSRELVEEVYPCTPMQEGLMAVTEQRPAAYRARLECDLSENANLDAITAAWEEIVIAHKVLRTRIVCVSPRSIRQVVLREPWQWDKIPPNGYEAYLKQTANDPMGFGTRLVRGGLVRDSDNSARGRLIITIHHAVTDRWSLSLILQQLRLIYRGTPIPDLLGGFSRFVHYARQQIEDGAAYWRQQLRGIEAPIFPALPQGDYIPIADDEVSVTIDISPRIVADHTVSAYIRLAWARVIAQNTATDDVVFGETVHGRNACVPGEDVSQINGPAITTVPRRIRFKSGQRVLDALSEIQQDVVRSIPFEQAGVQNIRRYSNDADIACMFQNALVIQPEWGYPGDIFGSFQAGKTTLDGFSSHALALECNLAADETRATMVATFDRQVIGRARVERLLQQFDAVLLYLLQNPYHSLVSTPWLARSDLDCLCAWNATVAEPPAQCIHDAILEQSRRTPSAPAIDSWDGLFTYAELNTCASQLATELVRQGIRPGALVPLLFERSRWMPVAMLAVNKAGGAFIPLDAAQPLQRLQSITRQVDIAIVLCSETSQNLAGQLSSSILTVGDAQTHIWNQSVGSLPVVHPTAAAYVVFTSGSTGTPKGVVVEHRSYYSSAVDFNRMNSVDAKARVLQFASYGFDASLAETLGPLMAGACSCVPSEEERRNELARAIRRMQVTHAWLTPTASRLLWHEPLPSLRIISLMGEAMRPDDCDYWAARLDLINGYGPTECSVSTSFQYYTPGTHVRDIGRPRATVAWIVDPRDHERLMPVGAVGELLLEGPPVARGYLNDVEKTAQAFISAPSWLRTIRKGGSNYRIYKTGDLVQYNEDGSLRFVGRVDTQLKLRGQRIEVSEIETRVRQLWPSEGEVAVAVDAFLPGNDSSRICLAVFVTFSGLDPSPDSPTDADADAPVCMQHPPPLFRMDAVQVELRLQQELPQYMVPTMFVPLSRMPLMPSGKVDRPRLKREMQSAPFDILSRYHLSDDGALSRPPQSAAEKQLQQVWAQVLAIEPHRIGLNTSFFHLGGDSITAMQAVISARAHGLHHSTTEVFQYKTIAQILEHSECSSNKPMSLAQLDDTVDGPPGQSFGLSPMQQFFFETNPVGLSRFSHTVTIGVQQLVASEKLHNALLGLLQAHAMLRARFQQTDDGCWAQYVVPPDSSAMAYAHHPSIRSHENSEIIRREAQQSLDIVHGPVFAAHLVEWSPRADYGQSIILVAHHLVVDVVSWRTIISDLQLLLEQSSGPLPTSVSFETWSRLQAAYAQAHLSPPSRSLSPTAEEDVGVLKEFWGIQNMPNTWGNAHKQWLNLDASTTHALLGPANLPGDTKPVELLHAAIILGFCQTFQQRRPPVIVLEAHGRESWDPTIDITRTVGWFSTFSPIAIPASQGSPADQVQAVLRSVKDAYRGNDRQGWAYFTSRYHNSDGHRPPMHTVPIEIVLNFVGRPPPIKSGGRLVLDELFDEQMLDCDPAFKRFSLLDINAIVVDNCLQLHLTRPGGMDHVRYFDPWMDNVRRCLERMAVELTTTPSRFYTLTDFPHIPPNYTCLDATVQALADKDIPIADVEDAYPCAPVQLGMLLAQARQPALYHVAFTWEVLHACSVDRVRDAVAQLIARHGIFRTSIIELGVESAPFIQVIRQQDPREICVLAVTGLHDIEVFPGQFAPDWRHPSRFSIYHSGPRIWVRLDISHVLWDGYTALSIERELGLACQGNLKEATVHPPSFWDYINYQQQLDQTVSAAFWQDYLKACQPCLVPPTVSSSTADDVSQARVFNIDHGIHTGITRYCERADTTPAHVFCLAWAIVLRQLTGQDEVCFGRIVSGRDLPLPGVMEMVGPLLNLLPCRINLASGDVSHVLKQIYTDYAASLAHQTCHLACLPHSAASSPMALFNTQLSIRPQTPSSGPQPPTRTVYVESPDPQEFLITVYVIIGDDTTTIGFRYWQSTLTLQQVADIETTFRQAIALILEDDHAPATSEPVPNRASGILPAHERALRQAWAETLNVSCESIGVQDDFFHHGGHSALALRLVVVARKKGLKLSVADVFAHSAFGALARVVRGT